MGCLGAHNFFLPFWGLWKHRNRVVFENTPLNSCLHKVYIQQAMEYHFCVGRVGIPKPYSTNLVRWHKPDEGWFKLNSNEASLRNSGKVGGGGVIRDCNGTWIKGYQRRIGTATTTSILAEFWVLRDGLTLADQLVITHLVVELDAKVILELVLSNNNSNKAYSPLLNDCMFLLNRFQHFKINHVFREANRAADKLAKDGCSSTFDFVILDYLNSDELCNILNSYAKGLYTLRQSANTPVILY